MFIKQLSHILAFGSNQTSDMFIDHCFSFLIRGTLIFYHNYKHNYLDALISFIAGDILPLSIVESSNFKMIMNSFFCHLMFI